MYYRSCFAWCVKSLASHKTHAGFPSFPPSFLLPRTNRHRHQFGKTALHWAAEWGRRELLEALLEAGADIDKRDGDGRTPIMCAAFQDQTEAGEFFIQHQADLTLKEYKVRLSAAGVLV